MTWKDKYQEGKFRGVAFKTTNSNTRIGRRNVTHEYPLRNKPYVEDLGRKAREFSLTLFVIGLDYMDERDALQDAIEKEGPGTLIHPYRGQMRVSVKSCRVTESTREGGMAKFDVVFIEAGENKFPVGKTDSRSIVKTKSDSALGTIESVFNNSFSVENKPEFISTEAGNIVTDITDQLSSSLGVFPTLPNETTNYISDLSDLSSTTSAVVRKPATLSSSITGLFSNIAGLLSQPTDALKIYRRFFNYGDTLSSVPSTTEIRKQQLTNQNALVNITEQSAVIEAARASSDIEFDSLNEAAAVRDELAEELDRHMLTADDETFVALQSLRAEMIKDITVRGADLATVVDYTPGATLPALAVAHNLYGDATKESDIVARNQSLRHPGFVQGGKSLEVLTSVA